MLQLILEEALMELILRSQSKEFLMELEEFHLLRLILDGKELEITKKV